MRTSFVAAAPHLSNVPKRLRCALQGGGAQIGNVDSGIAQAAPSANIGGSTGAIDLVLPLLIALGCMVALFGVSAFPSHIYIDRTMG